MTSVIVIAAPPPAGPFRLADLMIGPTVVLNVCCSHPRREHAFTGCVGHMSDDSTCRCTVTFRRYRARRG